MMLKTKMTPTVPENLDWENLRQWANCNDPLWYSMEAVAREKNFTEVETLRALAGSMLRSKRLLQAELESAVAEGRLLHTSFK